MGNRTNGRGRTKRESAALAARRAEVLRRWMAGASFREIAKSLKVSKSTVGQDALLALDEQRRENRASISEARERELRVLNRIEVRLEAEFERTGDWKILAEGLIRCSAARRKLLGLDAPAKIESQTTAEVNYKTTRPSLDEIRAKILADQAAHLARLKANQELRNDGV